MTINGSRRFKGNDGKSYFIQNAHKTEQHKGKYILTVKEDGLYKVCRDLLYDTMYFNTIKEAQREVLYAADFIRTM